MDRRASLRLASFLSLLLLAVIGTLLILRATPEGLGLLAWRMTPSLSAGLILSALFVASGEMLQVHAVAMSEPLFIFLSLLSLWMFDLYFERDHHWLWLILCALFVGAAYLTRYAGLALAGTFVLALVALITVWGGRP